MWLGFIVASILITLMPGPSMLVVIMNTLQRGVSAGIISSIGVVVADALLLVLTLSGIGALLYSSALAFTLVKWCGVAYLVYLGIRQLVAPSHADTSENKIGSEQLTTSTSGSFVQGFATTMLNPKIISFFIAFFPQFLDPELPAIPQILMLGPVFLLIVFVILVMYTMLAKAARAFLSSPRGQICVRKLSGGMLIGCGIVAAGMER